MIEAMTMIDQQLSPGVTIADAQQWLELMKYDDGVSCPCCGQFAKVYWRALSAPMARALILFWREGGTEQWVHGPTVLGGARADEGKLRYWGLVERSPQKRGHWRVTPRGERFVKNELRVPRHALVYDSRHIGFGDLEDLIGVRDALSFRFSYSELMGESLVRQGT